MTRLDENKVRELWERYKYQGDKAARDRLILAYSPLVKYVAGRMSNGLPSHIEEADLISYGLLGSSAPWSASTPHARSSSRRTPSRASRGRSSTSCVGWIGCRARCAAMPARSRRCVVLENRLQRAPTDSEIAAELHISVKEFQQSLTQIANTSIVALDELWSISGSDGDQASLIDTIEDPKSRDPSRMLDLSEMKARLAAAIDALPKREKIVIALYYYENLTLREIGEVLGVTESRVSQLHTKAILRLKGRLRDEIEPAAIG